MRPVLFPQLLGGGWAWHRGLEALQGWAGEHLDRRWTCVPFFQQISRYLTTVDSDCEATGPVSAGAASPTSNRTGLETGA